MGVLGLAGRGWIGKWFELSGLELKKYFESGVTVEEDVRRIIGGFGGRMPTPKEPLRVRHRDDLEPELGRMFLQS